MNTRWIIVALVSLLTTVIHGIVFSSTAGQRFEPFALDIWFNLQENISPPAAPQDVVLIAMDEQSYSNLNLSMSEAWPRELHAKLTEKLAEAGAKRVVFDILFLGPGKDALADQKLADAIKKVPTVMGSEISIRQESTLGGTFILEEYQEPHDLFVKDTVTGLVALPAEQGRIRRFYSSRPRQFEAVPTLAEAGVGITDKKNAILPGKRDFINYYGPPGRIATFYYSRVMEEEMPLPLEALFKDKVVFIGLVLRTEIGPAQKDVFVSPFFGRRIFGSEIHATIAANLVNQDWIRRGNHWVELILLSLYCFLVSCFLFALRPHWGIFVLGGSAFLWSAAAYIGFLNSVFLPGISLSIIVLPLAFLGSTLYYYFVTRRSQLQIKNAFEHYVSPEMAKQMAQNTKSLRLGGEKIWATVMFTDIAGFTQIAEGMPAEKVSRMLNAYFTEVMEVIFENRGTLIKFIGDAVFVIWGAPIKIEEHADLAAKTAIEVQRVIKEFNKSGKFPELNTRIGLNTGPMVVGNLGSERRFDYTAIGDAVNLGARVEGLNKYFGTDILLTEYAIKELSPNFEPISLGSAKVVGKKELVELFTLFDPELDEPSQALLQGGLMLFKERSWDEAEHCMDKLAEHQQLKNIVTFYKQEIQKYRDTPPPADWKGGLEFTSK